jgi:hypothetical protein
MANTIGYGQGAVNNTNGFGKAPTNNTIDFGEVCADSWSPETNLTGTPAGFSNTQSIELDGVDDFVNVADNSNLSFGNGTTDSPFSISCWVKLGSTSAMGIVSKYGASSSTREWLFYTNAGKPRILLFDKSNSTNAFAEGNTALSTNTFYHITCTYDGRGGSTAYQGLNIYVDGVLQSLTISGTSYTAMHNTSQPVEIGKYTTNELLGYIDEVAVFNSELSATDVTTIYNSGTPNDISSISGLVSWWRFEGSGTTATDSGSGGNDGTLTNGATRSTDVPT